MSLAQFHFLHVFSAAQASLVNKSDTCLFYLSLLVQIEDKDPTDLLEKNKGQHFPLSI